MAKQMRVHILAKDLNVSSKDIISKCQAEGLDVKNHMSTLGPGLEATIREWFSEGSHSTVVERAARVDLSRIKKKQQAKEAEEAKRKEEEQAKEAEEAQKTAGEKAGESVQVMQESGATAVAEADSEAVAEAAATPVAEQAQSTPNEVAEQPSETAAAGEDDAESVESPVEDEQPAEVAAEVTDPGAQPIATEEPVAGIAADEAPADEAPVAEEQPVVAEESGAQAAAASADAAPEGASAEVTAGGADEAASDEKADADGVQAAGPQNVPRPAKLSGPRVVRYEAPEDDYVARRPPRRRPAAQQSEAGPDVPATGDGGDARRGGAAGAPGSAGGAGGPGRGRGTTPRTTRRTPSRRSMQQQSRDAGEQLSEWRNQDLEERKARLAGATGRKLSSRRSGDRSKGGRSRRQASPITKAEVTEPIILKDFCSAIGVPFQQIFPVLTREHNLMLTITSTLPSDVAELVALNFGVELSVVAAKTKLDELKEEFDGLKRDNLKIRPPIITMLGHVDHGKTSLLDAIRRARVASKEDGGITQHISSYHYKKGDVAVTFLDTPGHEAFTALRARGAQLTDIVVLVIAADDGVMPQTIEAINHAKAAKVPIVVALNKIDLGDQNVMKIYGQLAEYGLTPAGDWGGEIDVIHTSATSGVGITELLEHLSELSSIHEFKADPAAPGSGAVIEAESRPGVGSVLQAIVRDGTLSVGDAVVCGNAFGKVRALRDDRGKGIQKAGPSIPVEIWGMNEVPAAGDRFFAVENLQRAKDIAEEVKSHRVSDARHSVKKARSLEDLVKHRSTADIPELNVIIKADVDGSVEVLRSTLEQFPSDEVKLNILHAGVGAVTDSDVHLASASSAIIVAFRVTAPANTRRLAEQEGVDVRNYKVIYNLSDDIKKALEGLLAPDEVVEQRGSAEVREVFRVSKIGLVAGCYVRDGIIANNHLVRVIRDGVLVRDNCRLSSLRRFKDDTKEVRSGFECGIRLEGFDDVKVGDTIESYEVIEVARTLS